MNDPRFPIKPCCIADPTLSHRKVAILFLTTLLGMGSALWGQARHYTIPSWGDFAVVYAAGTDPAMDSPEAMERQFAHWKARGYAGVFLRSDLQQYAPYVVQHTRSQPNPPLALMWRHIDRLAERFDYFAAAAQASARTGLEFWVYHPHIYSEGAPVEAGTPGPGRMVPWSYQSKILAEHPEMVSVDRRGNRYWMVPEYAYPELRRAKAAEFSHMAKKYGIRNFIANFRSEISQLQDPADKADRYGFNAPVVAEMKRLHGVDILTDGRFDVDAPGFGTNDPLVEAWRDLRGGYLTELIREIRAALREADPKIRFAVTIAGERVGPPLGNWRTDWRRWVDEGLVDAIVSPVFFEATLDHEAAQKGYLTHARAGIGTVPHDRLKAYIKESGHPEIEVIAIGGPPYFFTSTPLPPGADALQCDAWYGGYHRAWYQRWGQWQQDLAEFGHIRFLAQDFDAVRPADIVPPSGAWGFFAHDPALRACPGAWWKLGTGEDARPFAQAEVRRGDRGLAMRLTRAADGSGNLTGWHNASPDRGRFASALDSSMTGGRAEFAFWVRRESEEGGLAAYLQGDNSEFECGVRVAPDTGRLSYSTGTKNGAGQWVESGAVVPAGEWVRLSIGVDITALEYRAGLGQVTIGEGIPLGKPKPRFVELPGVNQPIPAPAFKEFKSVLFVPEGKAGSVCHLDDVSVNWQPPRVFEAPGATVLLDEDYESGTGRPNVIADNSFGEGVHSLKLDRAEKPTLELGNRVKTGGRIVADLDIFIRSGESMPNLLPASSTKHPGSLGLYWEARDGRVVAGLRARNGVWQAWSGDAWQDTGEAVHEDVWNRVQLVLEADGAFSASAQPAGQIGGRLAAFPIKDFAAGVPLRWTVEPSPGGGHVSCLDNVRLTAE